MIYFWKIVFQIQNERGKTHTMTLCVSFLRMNYEDRKYRNIKNLSSLHTEISFIIRSYFSYLPCCMWGIYIYWLYSPSHFARKGHHAYSSSPLLLFFLLFSFFFSFSSDIEEIIRFCEKKDIKYVVENVKYFWRTILYPFSQPSTKVRSKRR